MNRAEFTERMQAIGTEEDETQRLTMIAQLIADGGNDYDAHEAAVTARDQALQRVQEVQEANMQLFLQIGQKDKQVEDPNKQPPEKRSFKNLFDDQGGIK